MVKVEYYYKLECPACQDFKKEWLKVKAHLEKNGFEFEEFKYDRNNHDEFIKKGINGIPTIKFVCVINKEKTKTGYTYTGNMSYNNIIKKLEEICDKEKQLEEKKYTYSKSMKRY